MKIGETTFDEVLPQRDDRSVVVNYTQRVTANTTYVDEWYGGNPGNYKTFAWGLNDACPGGTLALERVYKTTGYPKLSRFPYRSTVARVGPTVKRFRRRATINTYAETAPQVSLRRVNRAFQTGVDRILTRAAD